MAIIACILLLLLTILTFFRSKEGFNPFLPNTKPEYYPDQSYSGDIILAQKYIQKLLDSPNVPPEKVPYLTDLLNLLQFI
jgi:hypothetical protein